MTRFPSTEAALLGTTSEHRPHMWDALDQPHLTILGTSPDPIDRAVEHLAAQLAYDHIETWAISPVAQLPVAGARWQAAGVADARVMVHAVRDLLVTRLLDATMGATGFDPVVVFAHLASGARWEGATTYRSDLDDVLAHGSQVGIHVVRVDQIDTPRLAATVAAAAEKGPVVCAGVVPGGCVGWLPTATGVVTVVEADQPPVVLDGADASLLAGVA